MKISRIIIKKFRSIKKADIWVGSINSIVGQNNSGKSCLLRALNACFNYEREEKAFLEGLHSYASRNIAKIEIHFNDFDLSKIPARFIKNQSIVIEISWSLGAKGCSRTIKYKSGSTWIDDEQCLIEVKKHIEFILIPPNRDANILAQVGNNILQLLVEEKMKEVTEVRDNYTVKFKSAINYLENNALKRISIDAKKEFPVKKPFEINIIYTKDVSYKTFLEDVGVLIEESGLSHPLIECGSGIQSLTIIALYNLLGKARKENIIIGLEEPETNLHPQAQRELIGYFKNLVGDGGILQFFFTTHSSQIIDQVDHTEIILFKKIKDEARGFITKVTRLPEDFFDIYELNEFKYYQFHRYRNSDFFFSSHIVITESKNEIELIKKIGESSNFDYEINGLSYLNLEGVNKAKYTIYLLNELEIPYVLIVDKDFFASYANDSFDNSLGTQGLPIYKDTFSDEELVKYLIPDQSDRDNLLSNINTNHTNILDTLEQYDIICMRYSLDLDLVAIQSAQEMLYQSLQIPAGERDIQGLVARRKSIKKIENILTTFEGIETRSWPYSYSRIKKVLARITKDLENA